MKIPRSSTVEWILGFFFQVLFALMIAILVVFATASLTDTNRMEYAVAIGTILLAWGAFYTSNQASKNSRRETEVMLIRYEITELLTPLLATGSVFLKNDVPGGGWKEIAKNRYLAKGKLRLKIEECSRLYDEYMNIKEFGAKTVKLPLDRRDIPAVMAQEPDGLPEAKTALIESGKQLIEIAQKEYDRLSERLLSITD